MGRLSDAFAGTGQSYKDIQGNSKTRIGNAKIWESTPLNARGLLDAATAIPVAGDALSGGMAVYDALRGDYGSAAMNAVGVLPFIGGAGMIKQVGNVGKKTPVPSEYLSQVKRGFGSLPVSETWDSAGLVKKNMNARVSALENGDYLARFEPQWGGKGRPFYAVGDDPEELASYALTRIERGDRAAEAAAKRSYDNSLIGMLENEYGKVFKTNKSERSASNYITHEPSGQKIRISDHSLPLGYVQADLDVPIGISVADQFSMVKRFLK